jgi:hypothetical protein
MTSRARLRWLAAGSVLAGAVAVAAAAPSSAAAPTLALERVAVTAGALPVRGSDGVLFEQRFGPDCEPIAAAAGFPAFAGTVGSRIELEVAVESCPRTPDPRVECSWRAVPAPLDDASCRPTEGPETSGTAAWQGHRGRVVVEAPATTGTYDFFLTCHVRGSELPMPERRLFVTRGAPLLAVSPPAVDWYQRAGCWAAGFTAASPEGEILAAIVSGIYRYGQENWRYAYSNTVKPGRLYRLPLRVNANGRQDVDYRIKPSDAPDQEPECTDGPLLCKCSWQGLVADATICNNSDCFVFSDVLHAIAGVMGVGGLLPVRVRGAEKQGFVTIPVRSFDPDFAGNILCGDEFSSPQCFPYLFAVHSLRLFDGRYFDATFGRIYASKDAPVALSISPQDKCVVELVASPRIMLLLRPEYGSWPFYFGPPGLTWSDLPPPVCPKLPATDFRLLPLDPDGDGIFEALEATVEVTVDGSGEQFFQAVLVKDGEPVAGQPAGDVAYPTHFSFTGEPGPATLRFRFSGEEIYRSGRDRPFGILIRSDRGHVARLDEDACRGAGEPACLYSSYGETGADFAGGEAIEVVDDGGGVFRVRAPLTVRKPGAYVVDGRLARKVGDEDPRPRTVGYASSQVQARAQDGPAAQEVELTFPCSDVAEGETLELSLVLFDGRARAIAGTTHEFEAKCRP